MNLKSRLGKKFRLSKMKNLNSIVKDFDWKTNYDCTERCVTDHNGVQEI